MPKDPNREYFDSKAAEDAEKTKEEAKLYLPFSVILAFEKLLSNKHSLCIDEAVRLQESVVNESQLLIEAGNSIEAKNIKRHDFLRLFKKYHNNLPGALIEFKIYYSTVSQIIIDETYPIALEKDKKGASPEDILTSLEFVGYSDDRDHTKLAFKRKIEKILQDFHVVKDYKRGIVQDWKEKIALAKKLIRENFHRKTFCAEVQQLLTTIQADYVQYSLNEAVKLTLAYGFDRYAPLLNIQNSHDALAYVEQALEEGEDRDLIQKICNAIKSFLNEQIQYADSLRTATDLEDNARNLRMLVPPYLAIENSNKLCDSFDEFYRPVTTGVYEFHGVALKRENQLGKLSRPLLDKAWDELKKEINRLLERVETIEKRIAAKVENPAQENAASAASSVEMEKEIKRETPRGTQQAAAPSADQIPTTMPRIAHANAVVSTAQPPAALVAQYSIAARARTSEEADGITAVARSFPGGAFSTRPAPC